jgi:hypothetical protein
MGTRWKATWVSQESESVAPNSRPSRAEVLTAMIMNSTVPWWRYLLGMADSATKSFTLFIYFRLHRRYYTTVELEFSNSRTVDPRTLERSTLELSILELSTLDLSNSRIRWLAVLFYSSPSRLANRCFVAHWFLLKSLLTPNWKTLLVSGLR